MTCKIVVVYMCTGIGCTLGNGVYVITGIVAHSKAGPAVLLSYMIAGFASLLAGEPTYVFFT